MHEDGVESVEPGTLYQGTLTIDTVPDSVAPTCYNELYMPHAGKSVPVPLYASLENVNSFGPMRPQLGWA